MKPSVVFARFLIARDKNAFCNIALKMSPFPFCAKKSAGFPSEELLGGKLRGGDSPFPG